MKVVKITETELANLVAKVLREDHEGKSNRYMFFQNLEQMKRQCDLLLNLDEHTVSQILDNGHDWADDHVSEAKNNLDQVFDFMMNEIHGDNIRTMDVDVEVMDEGRKKTGTKLCARGKAAAKARYDVFPSAYSNGHGVQVCKGKIKGLDGKKRCSPPYC
jgi:hypothetical protein